MRSAKTSILVISAVLAAVLFGIVGMNAIGYNGQHSCPISALAGDNCSPLIAPIVEAFHHLSGLQSFVQGAVNTQVLSGAFLIIVVSALSVFAAALNPPALRTYFQRRYNDAASNLPQRRLLHWLVLHQKRDPHVPQRVHDYS